MNKNKNRKLLLLPGDGIGPEVVGEVRKVIEWFNKNKSLDFKIEEELIGGASIDAHKIPITDEVWNQHTEEELGFIRFSANSLAALSNILCSSVKFSLEKTSAVSIGVIINDPPRPLYLV